MNNTINTIYINNILNKQKLGKGLTRKESIFYNNMENTLKSGYLYAFTDLELIEYTKCANDIIYFIENYAKIQNTETGEIETLKLRPYQYEMLKMYNENRFTLFNNSRQIGFSLISAIIYLYETTFNIDNNILSIHDKTANGIELLDKVKFLYKNLPYFLKKGIITWNKNLLIFDNNSKINIVSKVKIIDDSYNIIHINDFSHIPHSITWNIYIKVLSKNLSTPNFRIIISSSPNGFESFYDLYEKSNRKDGDPEKNLFKSLSTYWWEVPDRDQLWKEEKIKMLGSAKTFEQEYNCQFFTNTTKINI